MARRSITVRVSGRLVQGVHQVAFELEDDKGNWLPIATGRVTSDGNVFTAEADTGSLVDLTVFDKAVKDFAAAQVAMSEAALAAQANNVPAELVTVTPQGQPVAGQNTTGVKESDGNS